jgi:SAM-dependent methyltransferase
VRSVVDVGCGDWQLGSLVDWSNVTYLGVDVVADLVETNTRAHAASNVSFRVADATTDRLPAADLLLAKDVLQHWPISAITRFLSANVGRYRYQLLTNDVASTRWAGGTNEETGLGGWRTLDLEAPPFDRRAAWRADYDVHGEWTKRLVLYASRPARLAASWRRCTALSRLRAALPMDGARPLG